MSTPIWTVSDAGTRIAVSDDTGVVAYLAGCSAADRAAARLMAAAPQLLSAAIVALDVCNRKLGVQARLPGGRAGGRLTPCRPAAGDPPRDPMNDIEREIQAKGLTAPRITPADIEAEIASEHYFTAQEGQQGAARSFNGYTPAPLALLTFCVLVLRNGFTVTGESACASPENFNAEIGRKIARQHAIEKVWPLMGYELRSKLASTPSDYRDRVRVEAAELDQRINKLWAFRASDTFNTLPKGEQSRLNSQLAAMHYYRNCLADRIAAFGSDA